MPVKPKAYRGRSPTRFPEGRKPKDRRNDNVALATIP